jgi:hypothetical protein
MVYKKTIGSAKALLDQNVIYRDRNLEMRDRSKLLVTCSINARDCQGQLEKVHVLIVCTRFFKKLESNS